MTNNQDPQFELIREYHVLGVEDGHRCRVPCETFEEAEKVRREGHPQFPRWKANQRRRVLVVLTILRRVPDPSFTKGWTRDMVGQITDCGASCREVEQTDKALRRLAETPHVNRCSDLRTPTDLDTVFPPSQSRDAT